MMELAVAPQALLARVRRMVTAAGKFAVLLHLIGLNADVSKSIWILRKDQKLLRRRM
jgi:hypothetical protein